MKLAAQSGLIAEVLKTFRSLKQTCRYDDLIAQSIVLPDGRGYLVPVCQLHAQDKELLETFARWRNENVHAFPTQFEATLESTQNWIRNRLLDVPERLLFLVLNEFGRPVGHLGWLVSNGEFEVDNVVRGVRDISPGIMAAAMRSMIHFARNLSPDCPITLRCFADNQHAVEFYAKLGFVPSKVIHLKREELPGKTNYLETPLHETFDKRFLVMSYHPQDHFA